MNAIARPLAKGMALHRRAGAWHGPYAESWYDESEGCHRIRLTAEGREKVAEYLKQNPIPVALLTSSRPGLYRVARSVGLTHEEIGSLCYEAITLAFSRYDSTLGAISTFIVWNIRWKVTNEIRRIRRHNQKTLTNDDLLGELATMEDDRSREEDREQLKACFGKTDLSKKEQEVMSMVINGDNDRIIARVLKITYERVRQLRGTAISKIRRVSGFDHDWQFVIRSRLLEYLSSQAQPVARKQICKDLDVAPWQLRPVLFSLVRDGYIERGRVAVSRGRWRIVFGLKSPLSGFRLYLLGSNTPDMGKNTDFLGHFATNKAR